MSENSEIAYKDLLKKLEYLEGISNLNDLHIKVALDSANTGIFEWNIVTGKLILDEKIYKYWGLPTGTPLNTDILLEGIHKDDRTFLKNIVLQLIEKGTIDKNSIQFRATGINTGVLRWVEATGQVLFKNRKPWKVVGTVSDITQWKLNEESLKKWENIFRFARWGIAIGSPDGKTIELLNPECALMHGYTVKELTGKPISNIFAPENLKDLYENIEIAHKKGHHVWESVHLRKDGTRFPVSIDISTVKNNKGEIQYRIVNVIDITERKKTEQTKLERENYYKYLFQNLNSNFAVHEIILDKKNNPVDYRFLEVNSAFEKDTGLEASEIIGKTARELFPNTEQYWINKFGEVALTGKSTVYENYSIELDRYYELKLYSPQKGRFAMLATDITERKLADKKLKEAKEHFELLFNLNPDIVNILRLSDKKIISINNGFTNLLGYTKEDAIGKTTIELNIWVNPDEREKVLSELLKTGECKNFEGRFRCKNDKVMVGILSAKIIDICGSKHILSVTRDITPRKQFETALVKSEKNLKESQKIAGLGSYKLNFKKGKWESSEILDSIFGIDPTYNKSIEGWINLIHPDWQEIMSDYIYNDIIANKGKFEKEYKIIRPKDKKEIWVQGKGELIFDESGNLLYMTGTITDITDRKQDELTIQKQNKELQKLNETKDILFSIIAHDLRSPFSSLLHSHELVINMLKDGETDEAIEWCTAMSNTTRQTYDLLENLLEWFQARSNQMTPNISVNDLMLIVNEVVYLFNEVAKQKEIRIKNNILESLPLSLDKNITKTIIRNLLSNAIKYTNAFGLITIDFVKKPSYVEIIISDTGTGISEEIIPSLFAIGKNKSVPGTSREKGAGLGLIICKDLVELQGGTIWAESEKKLGTKFHFTIPK